MLVRARAPLRISFAGGGTDIREYYERFGGAVVNATIGLYCYTTLKPRSDRKLVIRESLYGVNEEAELDAKDGLNTFFGSVVRRFNPLSGFELYVSSDTTYGSGLGSSSTAIVSVVVAFNKWLSLNLDLYDLAELAYQIERLDMRIKGGKQDQYAAVFGGFNFIEFYRDKVIVNSMRLSDDVVKELQFRCVLVRVDRPRVSGDVIGEQLRLMDEAERLEHYAQLKRLASEIKNRLYMGKVDEIPALVSEEWEHKKALSPSISNKEVEKAFKLALHYGVQGGKLLGAGGGGYILFLVGENRDGFIKGMRKEGYETLTVQFVERGAEAWEVGKYNRS